MNERDRAVVIAERITAGDEPGLRFACVLDGQGGRTDLDWAGVAKWTPGDGYLWIHLERDTPEAEEWLRQRSGIDPLIADALLAEESRPRVEDVDDALLVLLRGVNLTEEGHSVDLVPIHIWIDADRAITLRDKGLSLSALRDIRIALVAGKGPRRPGELFVQISEKIVKYMEPLVNEMEEEADRLDRECIEAVGESWRGNLAELRRQSINLRRYLAPQREALFRLQIEEATWLNKRDKVRLREVTDKVLRHVEALDLIRDRATILHEDLTAQISEQIAKTSNRLTAVAAMLLPPSLIAGMLGANISGIPGQDSPWAFAIFTGLVALLFPLQWLLLRWLKWL